MALDKASHRRSRFVDEPSRVGKAIIIIGGLRNHLFPKFGSLPVKAVGKPETLRAMAPL